MAESSDADFRPKTNTLNAWAPGPRLAKTLHGLVQIVSLIAGGGSMFVCIRAGELTGIPAGGLLGILAWFVVLTISVTFHEFGHYVAARMLGMIAVSAHVGALELLARRRGFRWRWKRAKRSSMGAVVSIPHPARGFRKQMAWYAAGGPLASLALGALSAVLVARLPDGSWQGLSLAFAVLNLGFFVTNLIPVSSKSTTDGWRLIQALRLDETDPGLTLMRLNALAMSGTTADRLPAEDVERLRTQEEPNPLFAFWFKLKALQNQLRWTEAAGLADELQQLRNKLPDPMRVALSDFADVLNCEIRYSALMAGTGDGMSPLEGLSAEIDWFNPVLRPRCLAAMAAVEGKSEEAKRWLQVAESLAEDSADAAQRTSESRIRADIASRLAA